jgi:hypothetical protein
MDTTLILTSIGVIITVIGTNVALFAWLRSDIGSLENKFEAKLNSLEERMFYLATGKSLSQAILEEKMNREKLGEKA